METIPAEQVLAFLKKRRASAQLDKIQLQERQSYRRAAAVLAGIANIESLKPFGPSSPGSSATELLGDDLVPVRARRLGGKVMLSAEVRRQSLSELAADKAFLAALAANPNERTGPVQAQFESYLTGNAKPIDQQALSELEDSLQALLWLNEVPIDHPSLDVVRRRIDYLRLLAPFESLASDAIFRGRQRELDSLRRYVGVLAPDALLSRLARSTIDWLRPIEQPALSVSGPGGVGKSALIARFMLEHARLPDEARIPFGYLDFERPILDVSKPLTLCAEMVRQLDLQFPTDRNFSRLFEFVSEKADEIADTDQLVLARSGLADLLGIIATKLGPRPYIVTLDTFEEVQYRGEASAFPFWDLLVELQKQWPFLRVIISGRAPATSLRLADKDANSLEIGALDPSAALAFLQAQGVHDPDMAARIVGQVGGVPLSLKLAASLVKREGTDGKGVSDLAGRSSFWFSASDEMIQGQLFERILGHIHSPQVERLAHPGLVMRRITPEVILNVLNEPCGLAIVTIEEAHSLFDELRNETALVIVNQDEDAEELVHRPDLRRIMLKLLVQKSPAQVHDIHERAASWYKKRRGPRARAEEIYHRLQLGERISRKAFEDRGVRFSIQASIDELPVESQIRLASYGLNVSKDILARASHEQQEAGMVAEIEELLPYGSSSVREAHQVAQALLRVPSATGAAFRSGARVFIQRGDAQKGLQLLEQGLTRAISANDTMQTLELLREKAWAVRHKPEEAAVLNQLNEYARRHQSKSAILQVRAQYHAFGITGDLYGISDNRRTSALAEIAGLIADMDSYQLWELVPALGLVISPLVLEHSIVLRLLLPKLIDDNGPFRLASFPDPATQAALNLLLNVAIQEQSAPGWNSTLASLFEQLCAVWPYRILRVQCPYRRRESHTFSSELA